MVSIWCLSGVPELRSVKLTWARAAASSNSTGAGSDVDPASQQPAGNSSTGSEPLRSSDLPLRIESFPFGRAGPRHSLELRQRISCHRGVPRALVRPRKLKVNTAILIGRQRSLEVVDRLPGIAGAKISASQRILGAQQVSVNL